MNLHEFTAEGIEEFEDLLQQMRGGTDVAITREFLTGAGTSRDLGLRLASLPTRIEDRFSLAVWLNGQLEPLLSRGDMGSPAMWTWLSAYLFDVIAPKRPGGTRAIRERARYVLEADTWNRYYRHLVAGPCRVLRAHWEHMTDARAVLAGRPDAPGELYEQVASRQEIITTPSLLRLTRRLYWDSARKALKPGAGGKGAGAARRLGAVLLQLERTWDLSTMPDEALTALLPGEFRRFLQS